MRSHLLLIGALAVAGCTTAPPAGDVDTSLASLSQGSSARRSSPDHATPPAIQAPPSDEAVSAMAERSGKDLQRALDELAAKAQALPAQPDAQPDAPATTISVRREPDAVGPRIPSPAEYAAAWNEAALGGEPPPELASSQDPDSTVSPDIPTRVEELARLMRERAETASDPMPARAALTIIESLLPPGTPRATIEHDGLAPGQAAVLDVLRESLAIFVNQTDPATIASSLENASARLAGERPFRIAKAELCARVRGYGQYDPMSAVFIAGRPHRVIVYVEVEGFGHRASMEADREHASTTGDAWTVELTQELNLYKDKVKAWTRSAQRVTESSRNRRRDFYLVHEIELPRNLGVGHYSLKVVMRDVVNDATDEAIVPITIVADESAVLEAADALRR